MLVSRFGGVNLCPSRGAGFLAGPEIITKDDLTVTSCLPGLEVAPTQGRGRGCQPLHHDLGEGGKPLQVRKVRPRDRVICEHARLMHGRGKIQIWGGSDPKVQHPWSLLPMSGVWINGTSQKWCVQPPRGQLPLSGTQTSPLWRAAACRWVTSAQWDRYWHGIGMSHAYSPTGHEDSRGSRDLPAAPTGAWAMPLSPAGAPASPPCQHPLMPSALHCVSEVCGSQVPLSSSRCGRRACGTPV